MKIKFINNIIISSLKMIKHKFRINGIVKYVHLLNSFKEGIY